MHFGGDTRAMAKGDGSAAAEEERHRSAWHDRRESLFQSDGASGDGENAETKRQIGQDPIQSDGITLQDRYEAGSRAFGAIRKAKRSLKHPADIGHRVHNKMGAGIAASPHFRRRRRHVREQTARRGLGVLRPASATPCRAHGFVFGVAAAWIANEPAPPGSNPRPPFECAFTPQDTPFPSNPCLQRRCQGHLAMPRAVSRQFVWRGKRVSPACRVGISPGACLPISRCSHHRRVVQNEISRHARRPWPESCG